MAQDRANISFRDGNRGFQAGIINGEVHNHAVPERTETPPIPSTNVPFRRDTDFVERGTLLAQVHQRCAVPGSWTALVGLGGVGKSQLAIEYCYQTQERAPKTWVLWVHASNAARFAQSYRDIADRLKISGRNSPSANIFKLVHDWLCDATKGAWVLILDNLDDASFLGAGHGNKAKRQENNTTTVDLRPLRAWLPQSQNGSILITTRTKAAALDMIEERDMIAIPPMDKLHALALLKKKLMLQNDSEDDSVIELATYLECMPLAIVQAAAYITQRIPRYSVHQYLDEFQQSDRAKSTLLDHEAGKLRRDGEATNSVILTWQISFDHIQRIRPSATELLSLLSFFDRQGIPEKLLRHREEDAEPETDQPSRRLKASKRQIFRRLFRPSKSSGKEEQVLTTMGSHADEFEDDLIMLKNYSFVAIAEDGTTFEMHALVQLAMREWLNSNGQLEKWKRQYIKALHSAIPDSGELQYWGIWEPLFPHVMSALEQQPEGNTSLLEWASLLLRGSSYSSWRGNYADMEKLAVASMHVRSSVLGEEHEDTLKSMALVGIAYAYRGQWKKSEQIELQRYQTCVRVLGAEHYETLDSMDMLAHRYRLQGQYREAEELYIKVSKARTLKLGAKHIVTLRTNGSLAQVYRLQRRLNEAEKLCSEVLKMRRKLFGPEHPDTLSSMLELSSIYCEQGRLKEAEELETQLVETRKRVLGVEHPDTLTSISNLALVYAYQERWKEVEELEVQVIETTRRVFGVEHPETLVTMYNHAVTMGNQKKFGEAIELMEQVVQLGEKVFGPQHPNSLNSQKWLQFWKAKQARILEENRQSQDE